MVRMNIAMQSNDHVSMVHTKYDQDLTTVPSEVFPPIASPLIRRREIQLNMLHLIDDSIVGDSSRVGAIVAQIFPQEKVELEVMAQVIVSKALDEPQHSKACVSLSGAIRTLLPPLPPLKPGKKGETFMHALLDVFQTEFEAVFIQSSDEHPSTLATHSTISNEDASHGSNKKNNSRIQAIVHFAWHLHCHGLLGKGVVQQMVQDLADNGQTESAKELLWCIRVLKTDKQRNLGTVLEDDGEGASSESICIA